MGSMSCLALNASFEPLTIVPTRRAIRLVLDRKAEILEVDDKRLFRSATKRLPCPSVIRLVRYVHVPRRFRRQVTNTFLFAPRRLCLPVLRSSSKRTQGPSVSDAGPHPPHFPRR